MTDADQLYKGLVISLPQHVKFSEVALTRRKAIKWHMHYYI